LEVAVNFGLPFAVYSLSSPSLGSVAAMMAASAPPILWSVATFIRERKLDAISLLVLSGIILSLLAFAGGGGIKVLQLRETLVAGLVGLIFLGSAAVGRPLIYELSRAGSRRRGKDAGVLLDALGDDRRFRRAMLVATLVWGLGLVAVCAVSCVLVFVVSIKTYMLIGGPIGYAKLGLLTAWTFWYVPREVRQALARRIAARETPTNLASPS
jgi:hypothetical protein